MKILLETVEEKNQLMGPDMEKITEVSIPEKNVDLIKSDYTNHRHTENFAELDGFSTSAGSDS